MPSAMCRSEVNQEEIAGPFPRSDRRVGMKGRVVGRQNPEGVAVGNTLGCQPSRSGYNAPPNADAFQVIGKAEASTA